MIVPVSIEKPTIPALVVRVLRSLVWMAIATLVTARAVDAGPFTVFGPQKYVRTSDAPVVSQATFPVHNASVPYTIEIESHGVASAVISINGVQIFGPSDFNANVTSLRRTLTLLPTNQLAVELRSAPDSNLTVRIFGVDDDPPTIRATATPGPNANGWNNTNVTVTFTCADAVSGIASCPPPVVVSAEGANQIVFGNA